MMQAQPQAPRPPGAAEHGQGSDGASLTAHELDAMRALRVLEERAVNLRKKAQLADENLLTAEAKLREEVRLVTGELSDVRRRLSDIESGLRVVEDEMRHAASIGEVRALEKYLAYWEPLQFVTQAEIVRRENLLKEHTNKH
jgi:hypothetical protein